MNIFKAGEKIRICPSYDEHDYKIGEVYTITVVDSNDNTLKARDFNGNVHGWIGWDDCETFKGIGWEYIQGVLPAEVVEFLSAFSNIDQLTLREEVKDRILSSLPDLHHRILSALSRAKA